jgi:hypothetical protein
MKRNFIIGIFGLSAAALLGCPVWGGGGGGTGTCYGAEYPECIQCGEGYQCPSGQACDANYYCVPIPGLDGGGTSTGDGGGEGGDCSFVGCSGGEVCAVVDGGAVCIPNPDGGLPDGNGGGDAKSDAPPFTGCTSNAACADAGAGYLCLDGKCVAPANQCTDTTQCPNNELCVQGACVPSCSSSNPCPTGYSCQTPGDGGTGTSGGSGVCTGNPTPCGAADGGTTCVDEHCVAPCSTGGTCPSGEVCVDNGCIPNQQPNFVCDKMGQAGGTQDVCASGSICLHHSCYIACSESAADAGGFCSTATGGKFDLCKGVDESTADGGTATFDVCASASNLGNQCDLTSTPPKDCSGGQVCIDGYCR